MIDREILTTRLSKLREALRKLKEIAARDRDSYLASDNDRALAEHYLRLALEAMFDTGNHVIATEGYRKPLQLREIPLILSENSVIDRDLAEKCARSAGLRNRLVHSYIDIDHEIIFDILQKDLKDLERFAQAVAIYYWNCGAGT